MICEVLKKAQESPQYMGKTEKFQMKDFENAGVYKWIIIKVHKFTYLFPTTLLEYEAYKCMEREYWGLENEN